ncbi:MAG: hypothetical protein JWR80_5904 [Bradyrhizobium sp.]|nr:hypothetical protein [Bradyrhizobium sp.]
MRRVSQGLNPSYDLCAVYAQAGLRHEVRLSTIRPNWRVPSTPPRFGRLGALCRRGTTLRVGPPGRQRGGLIWRAFRAWQRIARVCRLRSARGLPFSRPLFCPDPALTFWLHRAPPLLWHPSHKHRSSECAASLLLLRLAVEPRNPTRRRRKRPQQGGRAGAVLLRAMPGAARHVLIVGLQAAGHH